MTQAITLNQHASMSFGRAVLFERGLLHSRQEGYKAGGLSFCVAVVLCQRTLSLSERHADDDRDDGWRGMTYRRCQRDEPGGEEDRPLVLIGHADGPMHTHLISYLSLAASESLEL